MKEDAHYYYHKLDEFCGRKLRAEFDERYPNSTKEDRIKFCHSMVSAMIASVATWHSTIAKVAGRKTDPKAIAFAIAKVVETF